ncbi:MAG: hypothetical protein J0M33_29830, partial [Anaerolineae bacterium]|nr:hypothetical protein [Anaerolineae bacterium]
AFRYHRQHIPFEFIAVLLVSHPSLLTLSLLDISHVRQTGVRSVSDGDPISAQFLLHQHTEKVLESSRQAVLRVAE